jgi:hypothetical protein
MRTRIFILLFLLLLALRPLSAIGDGAFVPSTAMERIQIPDQRALLHYSNGIETLVIDTAFKGEGTNYAWIIPLPSPPVVEPATSGLFTTLHILFQPEIRHNSNAWFWPVVLFGVLVCLLFLGAQRPLLEVLLVFAFIVFISGLFLPPLGRVPRTPLATDVQVLARKTAGIYDTVTLSSGDGRAVFDWLKQNGFATPTNFIPAIQAYAREGWCFVASKVRLDATMPDGARAHPLSLKFKTDRPVYPLRLTGINNDRCRIELHVFGPDQAQAPHFQAERCTAPEYPPPSEPSIPKVFRPSGLRIRHPSLRSIVDGSPAATRLVAELDSRQMTEDAFITWTPLKEKQRVVYSRKGAKIATANTCVPVLMLGFLAMAINSWHNSRKPKTATWGYKFGCLLAAVSLAGAPIVYLCLPKIEVETPILPAHQMEQVHKQTLSLLLSTNDWKMPGEDTGLPPLSAGWIRRQLDVNSRFRMEHLSSRSQTNLWLGIPWHEEDSPGNFTLRKTDQGVDYVWYDVEGMTNVVSLPGRP